MKVKVNDFNESEINTEIILLGQPVLLLLNQSCDAPFIVLIAYHQSSKCHYWFQHSLKYNRLFNRKGFLSASLRFLCAVCG